MKIIAAFAYNSDADKPNVSLDQLKQLLFGEENSVRSYFKENSYNQLDIIGDVYGWIKLPYEKSSCNFLDWYNFVDTQVKAAGIKHGDYDAILYQFGNHDYNRTCKDSNASISTTGATTYLIEPRKERISGIVHPTALGVYLHEIGHGLSANSKIIGHASFLDCGIKSIDVYSNCKVINYGDPYDVMGHTAWDKTFLFNAASRYKVGWFSENQAPLVSANSTYTLTVLERSDPGIKAIRIYKPDTKEYYFISYRQPVGFDKTLPTAITRGISIHIEGSLKHPPDFPGIYGHTYLIDTTPDTEVTDNPALGDNEVFYDHINKILIKQLSHDENSAKVEISFGVSAPPTSDTRKTLQSNQSASNLQQISEEERIFLNQHSQQHLQEDQLDLDNEQLLTPSQTPQPSPQPSSQPPQTSQTAKFILSTSSNVNIGTEIPVKLYVQSDSDAANLFSAKLTFNKDLLEVVRVDKSGSFIKNWTEENFDNNKGILSLIGGVPNPGFKTSGSSLMASIIFKAKKTGVAPVTLDSQSQIFRNSDSARIFSYSDSKSAEITINKTIQPTASSAPYYTPSIQTPESSQQQLTPKTDGFTGLVSRITGFVLNLLPITIKGDGNGDGKVTIDDLSVLFANFNNQNNIPKGIDFNSDGVVNSLDYSLMVQLFKQNGIIK